MKTLIVFAVAGLMVALLVALWLKCHGIDDPLTFETQDDDD